VGSPKEDPEVEEKVELPEYLDLEQKRRTFLEEAPRSGSCGASRTSGAARAGIERHGLLATAALKQDERRQEPDADRAELLAGRPNQVAQDCQTQTTSSISHRSPLRLSKQ
jgi:hypothetical protein